MMNTILTDTNECQISNGNCSQNCINTNGSYFCTCTSGYSLAADGKTCNGRCINKLWMITICIIIFKKTQMNAKQAMETAHRIVSTPTEATSVLVPLVIVLLLIARPAMVSLCIAIPFVMSV